MYDAFSPRALSLGSPPNAVARPGDNPRLSLFGKTNVGHLHLTNIVVPHETGRDTDGHACVRSWYARTNVPLDRAMVKDAWNAWAHVTQATLCVGTMPVHAVPLVDLLGRKEGQDSDLPFTKSGIDWTGELAGLLCASYHHDTPAGKEPWETSFGQAWVCRTPDEQDRWMRAAAAARRVLQKPPLTIIPPRQMFAVQIDSEPRALRALLEVLPTDVAPQALVWVHLEGASVHCPKGWL